MKKELTGPKQKVLVTYLRLKGDMDRNGLSELSKMPRSTVYDILQKLIRKGLVKTYKHRVAYTGRPRVIYTYSGD